MFEPAMAVLAPEHGVSLHARLIDEAPAVLAPNGWLAVEVAAGQAARVVELLKRPSLFDDVIVRKDQLGWERVIAGRLNPTVASTLDTSEICVEPTTA
jgi:release factor glutamine methyltransferase